MPFEERDGADELQALEDQKPLLVLLGEIRLLGDEIDMLKALDAALGGFNKRRMKLMDELVPKIKAAARKKQLVDRESQAAGAEVDYTQAENERGRSQDCVFVTCLEADDPEEVGPVWGHGERSVKRALIQLTEECDCGARFHALARTHVDMPAQGLRACDHEEV